MSVDLRLDQHQVDKQHHKVMFNVFISESFASRTLCETHTLSQRYIVGLAVFSVERVHRISAFDANGHCIVNILNIIGLNTDTSERGNGAREQLPRDLILSYLRVKSHT